MLSLTKVKINKKAGKIMSTITINNFSNIEIVNLEYLGNNEWQESWGTIGVFGLCWNQHYHFGVRVKYLLPLDKNNQSHHLYLTLPFSVGEYADDYYVCAFDEINYITTNTVSKRASNDCFVIDLLHEAHYENGYFVFYIAAPDDIEQFCIVSTYNVSLMIDCDDHYRTITHVYKPNVADTLVYSSSNYGQRFTNAYNKISHNIDVFYPEVFDPNLTYPVIVTLHGGDWKTTLNNDNSQPTYGKRSNYQNNISFLTREANTIVVSIEYRLLVFENESSTNSWHADDENASIHDREMYANNYVDMLIDVGGAISYIKTFMPYINQNKIYLMGYSAGGHIALLYGFSANEQQINSSLVHSIAGIIAEAAPYEISNHSDPNIINLMHGFIDGYGNIQTCADPITYVDGSIDVIYAKGGSDELIIYDYLFNNQNYFCVYNIVGKNHGDMGFLLKVIQIINNQDFVYDDTNNYGQGINDMINPDND